MPPLLMLFAIIIEIAASLRCHVLRLMLRCFSAMIICAPLLRGAQRARATLQCCAAFYRYTDATLPSAPLRAAGSVRVLRSVECAASMPR